MPQKDTISLQLVEENLGQLGHIRGPWGQEGRVLAAFVARLEAQDVNVERRQREFDEWARKVGNHHDWTERATGKGAPRNAPRGMAGGGAGAEQK